MPLQDKPSFDLIYQTKIRHDKVNSSFSNSIKLITSRFVVVIGGNGSDWSYIWKVFRASGERTELDFQLDQDQFQE